MPAIWAVVSTLPLLISPARISESVLGRISMRPRAIASLLVSCFAVTSTMRARPSASRCDRPAPTSPPSSAMRQSSRKLLPIIRSSFDGLRMSGGDRLRMSGGDGLRMVGGNGSGLYREYLQQRLDRSRSVTQLVLLLACELGHRATELWQQENRVVAKASCPSRLRGD